MFSQVSCLPMGGGVCYTPTRQTLPYIDTPLGRHPQADTPQQTPPGQTSPWADTPLGRHPHGVLWDMVNKQAVRIPLECILVLSLFSPVRKCPGRHILTPVVSTPSLNLRGRGYSIIRVIVSLELSPHMFLFFVYFCEAELLSVWLFHCKVSCSLHNTLLLYGLEPLSNQYLTITCTHQPTPSQPITLLSMAYGYF